MKRSATVANSELSPSLSVRPQWCSKTWPSWKSSKAWPLGTSGNVANSGSAMASAYVARTHELIRGGPRDPPRVRRADRRRRSGGADRPPRAHHLEPASLLASACTIAHGCGAGGGAARAVRDHLLGPRAADAGEDGVETRKEVRKAITRATPPMCWSSGRPRAGDARPLLSGVPGLHGAHSTPGRFGTSLGTRKRARLATGGHGRGN